jgi:regulator of sigma E protease
MGISEVGDQMKNVVRFLYMLVTNKVQVKMLGGPGVIFYAATQEAAQGPTRLLLFLTMLSANLAIINFLPIPALDGGHMMFLAVEAIRGKPLDENLQMKLTMGGVMALLGLMLFVIVNDVLNLSQLFI